MQNKVPAWKKTALAALAVSMLAGSAAGVASAKHGRGGDDRGNGNNQQGNNDNHDGENDGENDGEGNGNVKIRYNLEFKDLNEQDWKWAYANIIRLCAEGVFKGYDDGSFKPQANISRIETIIAAVRLLGLETEAQKPENMNAKLSFKDFGKLKEKYPQAVGYVTVALKNDLFNENDSVIMADKPATRLWASVLLVKAMKLQADAKAKMGVELPFADAEDVPAGSVGYVAVAVDKGVIAGYPDNTFRPDKLVTRAELATILSKLGIQLPDQGNNDNQAITGTVTATVYASGTLTVKKADNTTVNVALDPSVFVFRNGVKATAAAIQAGDTVLVRTAGGKAIFIEVTQTAPAVVEWNDAGVVTDVKTAGGKISSISIRKTVNGVATIVVYDVDASATVTGGSGVLVNNVTVVLKGQGTVVKSIQIIG